MAVRSCGSCGGTGSRWVTTPEWDPETKKTIQVRRKQTCGGCGGSGKINVG